jgi:hypothetical protein
MTRKINLFAPGKHFHRNKIFVSKAGANPSDASVFLNPKINVVNEPKVGCNVENELGIFQVGQLVGHSLAFILGAIWAVEYLAKLSRVMEIFSKSFKAMILGFDFI